MARRSAEEKEGWPTNRPRRRGPRAVPAREDAQLAVESKLFRGLGDATRLRVLEVLLEEGERSVSELVELTQVPQGRLSSHLACLRWCGLATSRQVGRRVLYRVTDGRIRQLIDMIRSFAEDNAGRIFACEWMDDDVPPDELTLRPPSKRDAAAGSEG